MLLAAAPRAARSQTTGQIVGVVVSLRDSTPLDGAEVRVTGTIARAVTAADGRFVLIGLAPGVYTIVVRHIGSASQQLQNVHVQSGVTNRLRIALTPTAVTLPELGVKVQTQALLTPEITASRQVVGHDELASTPVQDIQQALQLRTGVDDGHFRGGRFGQETYVIDGVDVKDQFSAARNGMAFQLAPSAVEEISVFTSGFTADQGSAVSGVVNLVTRSGPKDHWIGRIESVTDEWAPGAVARGYNRGGFSLGGPLGFLPLSGSTLFLDLEVLGQADQDPRVAGLTCLPVNFPCPGTRAIIPHHRGDRYYAFGKLDLPITDGLDAAISVNRNRDQHELYSTRFKYDLGNYLAEREVATLGTLALTGSLQPRGSRAVQMTARVSVGRVDRYLGVPDSVQGTRIGRFRLNDLHFRGEDFVHGDVAQQIASGQTVPGYVEPSDSGLANPYGLWGADLFVTDGTSGIAEWSRSEFVDLKGELQVMVSPNHDMKIGTDVKLYHIQSYQAASAALAGAEPNYVSFFPKTVGAYIHNTLHTLDAATVDLGARVDAFQPQVTAPSDRRNLSAPLQSTAWRAIIAPRIGFGLPLSVLGVDNAAFHFNFGLFSQPPDFQYFFDQSLDDSLNTAVRRQGNPNLAFERATQYELGLEYLITGDIVVKAAGYFKDLTALTTSGINVGNTAHAFSNFDFGRVEGGEVRLEARFSGGKRLELGYALERAFGVVSSGFDSTASGSSIGRVEIPLQFDRRHAFDLSALWIFPGDVAVSVAGSGGSGLPVPGNATVRLPWDYNVAARVSKRFHLGGTYLVLLAEGRNLLNRPNLVSARPGGGTMPNISALEARADSETQGNKLVYRDSPYYLEKFDADHNNFLDASEQGAARRAALLDYYEPTLLYGEARQIRLGVQWSF
jgi:hypothetical protein